MHVKETHTHIYIMYMGIPAMWPTATCGMYPEFVGSFTEC